MYLLNAYTDLPNNPSGGKLNNSTQQWVASAKGIDYEDIYKNIEAVRQASYDRERQRGQFEKEFAGLGDVSTFLMGPLGLAAIGGAAYWWFCIRKKK